MQLRSLLAVTLFAATASSIRAQSLNVDIGPAGTAPSSAYGAGASQPGHWNAVTATVVSPQPLSNLNAVPVGATLTMVSGLLFEASYPNPGTTGDDEALMDDFQDGGQNCTWRFDNLTGGNYTVYTYAWAPDDPSYVDTVTCGVIDPPQTCGGAWPGSQTLGTTYTKHRVTVAPGGSITVVFSYTGPNVTTQNGFQLVLEGTPSTPFCDGSGFGTACLACGNNGSAGNGCANSSFAAGGHLESSGIAGASAGTDTLELTATNIPGPGLFIQANALVATPVAFGDGELCAAVGIIRLGIVFPGGPSPANTAVYPGGLTPSPIHIGGGPIAAGNTKHYQCWYRDATVGFCTGNTYNMTNGVSLTWVP